MFPHKLTATEQYMIILDNERKSMIVIRNIQDA